MVQQDMLDMAAVRASRRKRRDVLKAIGAVSAMGGLAGCGGAGDGGDGGDGSGDGGDGSDGGDGGDGGTEMQTLVAGYHIPTESIDPHTVGHGGGTPYIRPENGYETLVYFDPRSESGSEYYPLLATEVPTVDNGLIDPDAGTLEFPLREGVTFHTGGEMTAADVKYSFERTRDMGLSASSAPFENNIESITEVDDYTVRINVSMPPLLFLSTYIPTPAASVISMEAVEANGGVTEGEPNDWVAQNSAGTGPYIFEGGSGRDRWRWHEDYWDPDSVGVQEIDMRIVSNVPSHVPRLLRGEFDMSNSQPEFQTLDQQPEDELAVIEANQITSGGHVFNFDIPYGEGGMGDASNDTIPGDFFAGESGRLIRRAMGFAMDWQFIIDNTLSGHANKSNQMIDQGVQGYNPDQEIYQQDTDRAEELFREAGVWEEGFDISIIFQGDLGDIRAEAVVLGDELNNMNSRFNINTLGVTEQQFLNTISGPEWPMLSDGVLPISTDPYPYFELYCDPEGGYAQHSSAPANVNPEIQETTEAIRTEVNQEERLQMVHDMQSMVYQDPPINFMISPNYPIPHRPCVSGEWAPLYEDPHFKYWNKDNC